MRAHFLAPSLVAAVALLAACNKAPETATPATTGAADAPVVATVNGVDLTRPEFDIYEKNLLRNAKVQSLTPDQQNQVLDDLITMQIMAAQGEKDGLENEPDVKANLALLHMRVMADAESQKFVKATTPTDAELHAEYDTAVSQMDKNEYHARHILVASKDQADQVIKKLKSGAKFEDAGQDAVHGYRLQEQWRRPRLVHDLAHGQALLRCREELEERRGIAAGADAVRLARDSARGYPRCIAASLRPSEAAAHRRRHAQEAASVCGGLEEAGEDREEARRAARRRAGRSDGTRDVGTARRVICAARRFYPATPPPASSPPPAGTPPTH